jgi:hypothetical protein
MSTISVFSSAAQILSRPDSYPVNIVLIPFATIVSTLSQEREREREREKEREQTGLIIIMWIHTVKIRQHLKMLHLLSHILLHDR